MKCSVLLVVALLAMGAVRGDGEGRKEGDRAELRNLLQELAEREVEKEATVPAKAQLAEGTEQDNIEMRGDEKEADIEDLEARGEGNSPIFC